MDHTGVHDHGYIFLGCDSYYSSKMDNSRTPSIDFDLEDRPITTTAGQVILLEFSNTGHKPFTLQDTAPLKKMLDFSPPPTRPNDLPSAFLEEFNQMFTVTFDSEFCPDADDPEDTPQADQNQLAQKDPLYKQNHRRIPEIDFSFPVLAAVPSTLRQSCDKAVKSQIFRKESCFPSFHIKKRAVFKDKKNIGLVGGGGGETGLPATCRNQRKCPQLFFTSKATPRDSELAKKFAKKEEGRKGGCQVVEQARKIVGMGQPSMAKEGMKARQDYLRMMQEGKGRVSLLQKLPAIIR